MDAELDALRKTLKEILSEQHPDTYAALLKAWTKADLKSLAAYGPDSRLMAPDAKKILLENRNRAWIPQLVAMLNERHTYFITVGAAHLVGSIGVPSLMRAAGYSVDGPDAGGVPQAVKAASPVSQHPRAR
jgi:uncharacterized protein YbaP (TraB family)